MSDKQYFTLQLQGLLVCWLCCGVAAGINYLTHQATQHQQAEVQATLQRLR